MCPLIFELWCRTRDRKLVHAIALAELVLQQDAREAYVIAYADAFWIVGVGLIISLAAVLLLRKPPRVGGPVEAH